MAPAYREKPKGIVFKNGNRINYGQLFPKEGTTIMMQPRKLNSSVPKIDKPNIARDGTVAKRALNDIPIKPGMTRQTKGGLHDWLHGQAAPLDDEPNLPIKSHEKPIGFHSGMTDKQVIKSVNHPTAGQVLDDAARLGRPPEKV